MSHDDLTRAGFKERTRIAEARETILDAVSPHDRTDRVPLASADGHAVAEDVTAPEPVPSYDRAAMDGFAVQAQDTFGASDRSPAVLRAREGEPGETPVAPGEAVRVHTGSQLPEGADAVVMVEHTEEVADEVEVFDAVAEGENVGDAGEDVREGQLLFEKGHQLRPSDLGLLKSVGRDRVEVYRAPTVGVVPTGEELVQHDPDPGEIIETNGLTVSKLAEHWGAVPTYRDVVTDDRDAIRAAIQRDLTRDVIVTTGGSSVGERDLTPQVVDDLGEVLVHGVALKPGHPVALGVVRETPVLMLPGYPVACIVNAVQFLRPVLKRAGHLPEKPFPTVQARLTRKIKSAPGERTFARVQVDPVDGGGGGDAAADGDGDGDAAEPPYVATPTRVSGSGVLSSVALADGWVVVPEEREGFAEGETVSVQDWEWSA
ncbi:MAG: gephyrin-like molybdotransferase Glp [Haloferacaceae archaeon]